MKLNTYLISRGCLLSPPVRLCAQRVLAERNCAELVRAIDSVQQKEKDKLMYVAAQHLDLLQDQVAAIGDMTGGKTEQQQQYLRDRIQETEAAISEALEDVQVAVCDLSDES